MKKKCKHCHKAISTDDFFETEMENLDTGQVVHVYFHVKCFKEEYPEEYEFQEEAREMSYVCS